MKYFTLISVVLLILSSCSKQTNISKPTLPKLTTTQITTVFNTTAQGGGTIVSDGGSPILSAGICWSLSHNPSTSDNSSVAYSISDNFICSMNNLVGLTTYYVRGYATNSVGTGYGNEISFTSGVTFGAHYKGGVVFFIDSTGKHGLVAAESDQSTGIAWNNGSNIQIGTQYNYDDGALNTTLIINAQGNTGNYAAKLCRDYRGGGFTDWFLPALDQIRILREQYNIVDGFSQDGYWSSTEFGDDKAFEQDFSSTNAGFFGASKFSTASVRAIRAF